jgi:cystathionine beta-synthase
MALGLAALSAESATAFAIRGALAVSSSGASAKSSAGGGVRAAFRCRRGAAAGPSENSKESPKAGKFLVEEEEEGPTSSAAAAMDDLDGTTNAAAFAASSAKRAGSPNFLRSWLNANFEKKSDETGTTLDLLNLSSESIAALVDDSASRKISTASIAAPKVQEPEAPRAFASTVGNTKLVELKTITPRDDVRILLKCEFQNPGLSIKDRIAEHILNEAERTGALQPGGTVVTASSGNTAAAFAMLCSVRGYGCVAITNTKCSDEKVNALKAYGAEIVVTRCGVPPDHPEHYQMIESRLVAENPTWFGVDQYNNPKNPEAYYRTIAPEIWEQTNGEITHFVAAASTGGTISGIGRFMKDRSNGKVQVICPDPIGSIFHEFWKSGGQTVKECESFQVEGVGKDSIPDNFDISLIDAMPQVSDRDAFAMCRKLSQREGVLGGGSTGVNVHAAVELAKTLDVPKGEKATIVCVAPDSGVKYLSKIYNNEWLLEKGLIDEE